MGTLGRAASLVLATRWRVVPALSVELGVPGRRAAVFCTCWLSMGCANSAAFVAFCTGLWVSNPALVQGQASGGRPGSDCEVCKEFLNRFYNSLIINEVNFTPDTIEKELISFCLDAKGKENRLYYYLGATKDAATKILSGVTGPMSVHMPAGKICEKLKKMDSQICELKYGTNRAKFFFQYV